MTDKDGIDSNRVIAIQCAHCEQFMGSFVVDDDGLVNDREVKNFLNVNKIIPICAKCNETVFD